MSCPAPVMLNVSAYPWNSYDKVVLQIAKKRCKEIYDDSPCVKLFRKHEKQGYTVICGSVDKNELN